MGYRKNRDSNGKRRCPSGKVIYGSRGEVQKRSTTGDGLASLACTNTPREPISANSASGGT